MSGIKVFLVEDEMIIRNGVKRSIDWEKEGYEFVGEASDGELAYPLILKEKPDIMITDIRMPFMDGLELSRLVKAELPNIKILILSGYDEFQYAKEAIKIGVTDYLLKPISSAKLLEALGQVKENILQEREEKELLLRYSRDMQENTENEKSKLFDRLMIGEMSMGEAVEEGKEFGLNLSASCYAVCLFKILMNSDEKDLLEQTVQASEELEEEVKQMEGVCIFQRGISGLAFLVMEENERENAGKNSRFQQLSPLRNESVERTRIFRSSWEKCRPHSQFERFFSRSRQSICRSLYGEAKTDFNDCRSPGTKGRGRSAGKRICAGGKDENGS